LIKQVTISLLVVFTMPLSLIAQLVTSTNSSPSGLVQNVLLGPGVTVSNIMYSGSPSAIGSFTAAGTNLGINEGIVMTTGTVLNNGNGPQGPNNQAGAGVDNNVGGSTLLTSLVTGAQTFNAAILEFDFIPYSDTVRFKYVFGSDEYPEFAPPNNSGYNDVFGFFISGPGIAGIQNIAKLPNNGSIVSINNVNAITNSQFYNFNGDGNSPPYNSNPNFIQYDGFTDALTAVSKVQCGQTYHLILAVADVGDGQWDSGIFLEANSLSSKTPITINQTVSPQLFSNPNWIAEGCASATIELSRENNFNIPVTIPIQVSGTATNGTDYSAVPSSITLGSGQSNTSFTIDALFDGIPEGLETLTLTFQVTDPCGNITPIVINLFIQDVAPLDVTLNNPTITCPGDNINLTANVTGGLPTYEYLWNTGETSSSIEVVPTATGIYSIQVTDACLETTVYDSVLVTVPVYVPLSVIASDDIVEICPYVPQTINAIASGGSGIYSYQWFRANQLIGQSASIQVNPSTSTSYIVQVIDNCGAISYDTVTYTILSPPLIVNTSPNIELCPGDSAFISATASGGYGNYHFVWTHNGDTSQGIWVKPNSTFSYNVVVSDDCQTFTVSAFVVVTIVKPEANFIPISENLIEGLPISFYNLTTNGYTYQWYFGDGDQSTLINPNNIYDTAGTYYITLVAWDAKGCVDTITKPITILEEFYIYIPNAFIPDQDRINNFFSGSFIGVKWIKMEIFNRWGELIYFSEDQNFKWDGTYQGKRVPDGVYTWKLTYKPNRSMEELMTGHVNVLR
jgi:gliding motility-associated-like protein